MKKQTYFLESIRTRFERKEDKLVFFFPVMIELSSSILIDSCSIIISSDSPKDLYSINQPVIYII